MNRQTEIWKLYSAGVLLADLVVSGCDQPWFEARLEPQDAFESVRPLFERGQAMLDSEDMEGLEAVAEEIGKCVTLVQPDGTPVAEFLLHIKGDVAWWRY